MKTVYGVAIVIGLTSIAASLLSIYWTWKAKRNRQEFDRLLMREAKYGRR